MHPGSSWSIHGHGRNGGSSVRPARVSSSGVYNAVGGVTSIASVEVENFLWDMEAGDYQSPACVFIASFEPPQQSRHIQQLTALVLVLIPGEPPQITPICGLVHIPGAVWYPAAKIEPIYEEGRRLQVLFH